MSNPEHCVTHHNACDCREAAEAAIAARAATGPIGGVA